MSKTYKYIDKKIKYASMLIFSVFAFTLLVSGCSSSFLDDLFRKADRKEAVRGETVEINEDIDFYFKIDENSYKNLSSVRIGDLEATLLTAVSWEISKDLIVQQDNIHLEHRTVSWSKDDKDYSGEGLRLVVKAKITVGENAKLGVEPIILRLPNLDDFSSLIKAKPQFLDGKLLSSENIQIQSVNIHKSRLGKILTSTTKWVTLLGVLAVIIGIWVVLNLMDD